MGGAEMNEDQWQEILRECDKNNDGLVFYLEFIYRSTNKNLLIFSWKNTIDLISYIINLKKIQFTHRNNYIDVMLRFNIERWKKRLFF